MAKQETIKHLTDLMATVQMAHFKGREVGVRVHEGDNPYGAAISIDLYNFEGDGRPVCGGLTFQRECDKYPIRAYCIAYNPDLDWETRHLYILCCDDDGGVSDDLDFIPELVPEEVLKNVVAWLEKAMVPVKQEAKPDPKQIKELMDRWAHFCYSHPPYDEVILWMVGGSKQHYLYQHFCSKFNHLCSVCHEDTMSAWIKFYRELDDQWAERLMEYVYCEWNN